ncbi:hypothetical protein GQ55_9G132500 [Panicum hallii var. hallii]|uniref:Uncharacterized protein n=1 Tax=Panicum hallii var. hallii TaxID=1504633 RepID=A0A2T7C2R8_9POAL|nr:hypothetical protein GQ55_9G132500 [Panicum hallii var. hallii]
MGDHPRGRGRRSQGAAMRALRGARDLYVRGLRGLDRLLAAASPRRAGVGRQTSRVFGAGGDRYSEEELMRELVRAMQARRGAALSAGAGGSGKAEPGAPAVKSRGTTPLERINEDVAVVEPTS